MKKIRISMILVLMTIMSFSFITIQANEQNTNKQSDEVILDVSKGYYKVTDSGYTLNTNNEIPHTGSYRIIGEMIMEVPGSNQMEAGVKFESDTNKEFNVTLDDVTVDFSNTTTNSRGYGILVGKLNQKTRAKFYIAPNTVNTLKGSIRSNGIGVSHLSHITIDGDDSGKLIAQGRNFSSGIGALQTETSNVSSSVTINGGNIEASSIKMNSKEYNGPGIGGSKGSNGIAININGGNIKAVGGDYGSGIGSSYIANTVNPEQFKTKINITDGNIYAEGGLFSAGIGSSQRMAGLNCLEDLSINITGGTINTKGMTGIGSGWIESLKQSEISTKTNILIKGANIKAEGMNGGADIGGGRHQAVETLYIEDSNIEATTVAGTGVGIGSGRDGALKDINILDSRITVAIAGNDDLSKFDGCGIGSASDSVVDNLRIRESIISAKAGNSSAAIGTMLKSAVKNIIIEDSEIIAQGGYRSAAIGHGIQPTQDMKVNIKNSKIKATGGANGGAGIGESFDSAGKKVILEVDEFSDITAFATAQEKDDILVNAIQVDEINSKINNGLMMVKFKNLLSNEERISCLLSDESKTEHKLEVPQGYYSLAKSVRKNSDVNLKVNGLSYKVSPKDNQEDFLQTKFKSSDTLSKYWLAQPVDVFSVHFDSNGGNQIASIHVEENMNVNEPKVPIKDGYLFKGWYSDKNLLNKWSFDETIKNEMTLYAKWEKNNDKGSIQEENKTPNTGDMTQEKEYIIISLFSSLILIGFIIFKNKKRSIENN